MTRSSWKVPYINYLLFNESIKNPDSSTIRTMSRSSVILPAFIGKLFEVYTGRTYTRVYVEEKMVGHKFGEFSFTRKMGKIHVKKEKGVKSSKKIKK